LPANGCWKSGRTGCAASRFAPVFDQPAANSLVSLCLQSDISRESIMIRKPCSFFLKLDSNDERHRR